MPATWIIVLHYSGVDDTRDCLRSLVVQSVKSPRIVLVDNASDDDVSSLLQNEFPDVVVLRTAKNLGWAGGNNVGIEYAVSQGADRVVLVNNDAVADQRLIERLDRCGDAHPEFGILGPVVRDREPPQDVQTDGFVFNERTQPGFFRATGVQLQESPSQSTPQVVETDIVMGCCFWVRREVFESVGMIDDRYFLIHEESDFCLCAARNGFKVGVLPESLVLHRRSPSFREIERKTGKPWQTYFDIRNLALLIGNNGSLGNEKRSRWRSWREYLLYVYYCHSDAVERNENRRARAVAEGFSDAIFHRWGPYIDRRRPFATIIDLALRGARRVRRLFGTSGQVAVLAPMESPRSKG